MLQKKCLEEKEEKGRERMWEKHQKSRKREGWGRYTYTLAKETTFFTNMCIYKNDRLNYPCHGRFRGKKDVSLFSCFSLS